MYGVPADLPLDCFVDAMLERICLGIHIIHFDFRSLGLPFYAPGSEISVEGKWELKTNTGEIVDSSQRDWKIPRDREFYKIHKILGESVTSYEIHPPTHFVLYFKNGFSLTIYDDSEKYESFSIMPG